MFMGLNDGKPLVIENKKRYSLEWLYILIGITYLVYSLAIFRSMGSVCMSMYVCTSCLHSTQFSWMKNLQQQYKMHTTKKYYKNLPNNLPTNFLYFHHTYLWTFVNFLYIPQLIGKSYKSNFFLFIFLAWNLFFSQNNQNIKKIILKKKCIVSKNTKISFSIAAFLNEIRWIKFLLIFFLFALTK